MDYIFTVIFTGSLFPDFSGGNIMSTSLIDSLNRDNTLTKVLLVRTRFDNTIDREELPPAVAVKVLLTDSANGVIYKSGHIEWGDIIDNWPMAYENYATHNGQTIRPIGYG